VAEKNISLLITTGTEVTVALKLSAVNVAVIKFRLSKFSTRSRKSERRRRAAGAAERRFRIVNMNYLS
jgi:hypothetical protein